MNFENIFKNLFVLELANNHLENLQRGIKIINDHAKIVRYNNVKAAIKLQFRDVTNFVHPNFKKNHWVKQRVLPCLAPFYEVDASGKVDIDIGHVYMIMQEYGRFKNRRPWNIVSRQVYWDLYVKEQKKIIDDYNKKYKPKTPIKYFPWLQTYDEVFYDNPDETKTDKRIIKKEIQKKINEYLEEDPYEKTQSENQPEEIVANDDEDYVLEDEDPEAEQRDYKAILREIDEGYGSDPEKSFGNFGDEDNFGGKGKKNKTNKYYIKRKLLRKKTRKINKKKRTFNKKNRPNKRTRRRHRT